VPPLGLTCDAGGTYGSGYSGLAGTQVSAIGCTHAAGRSAKIYPISAHNKTDLSHCKNVSTGDS